MELSPHQILLYKVFLECKALQVQQVLKVLKVLQVLKVQQGIKV